MGSGVGERLRQPTGSASRRSLSGDWVQAFEALVFELGRPVSGVRSQASGQGQRKPKLPVSTRPLHSGSTRGEGSAMSSHRQ